jgi:hypothetical protein
MSTEEQETNFEKLCLKLFDIIHEETSEYLTEEMGFIKWSETYYNLRINVMWVVIDRLVEKMNSNKLLIPTKKSVRL